MWFTWPPDKKRYQEYFANALRVWLLRDEEAAKFAATTAVKIAPISLQKSMLDYLAALSAELRDESSEAALK